MRSARSNLGPENRNENVPDLKPASLNLMTFVADLITADLGLRFTLNLVAHNLHKFNILTF